MEWLNNQNLIVPFGKYKGKPIDVLAQDYEYCDWLLQQGWLQEKYGNVYTIIVNNFGEPTETPEHNKMQYECMKKENVIQIIRLLGKYKNVRITEVEPEVHGSDLCIKFQHKVYDDELDDYFNSYEEILVELKPCVGDDYPSILRQMKVNRERFISKDKYVNPFCLLVYGKYDGIGITEEEFRDFFKSCGFLVQKAWW